jgi:hypothetical protein
MFTNPSNAFEMIVPVADTMGAAALRAAAAASLAPDVISPAADLAEPATADAADETELEAAEATEEAAEEFAEEWVLK